jgi:NADPH:quinone reductase-like Zn-dependent oxidoreductase
MSQIVLTAVGDPAQNASLKATPDLKVGAGDVLVQMEVAPVNPVDFLFSMGWYAVQPSVPNILGAEGVGRVQEVGVAADQSLAGKRVVVLGTYEYGVWGDTVVVPARYVVAVPEDVDGQQLSMAVINPITAYLMLTRYVDLKPGDWIGQTLGNSAVAHSVVALASEADLKTLSVVRSEKAAREARAAGADLVLVDGDDLGDRVAEALGGAQLRLVLDGAGGNTQVALTNALEFGGTVVSYSSTTGEAPVMPLGTLVFGEVIHRGVWVVNWFRTASRAEIEEVVAKMVDLVARGVLSVPVDSTFSLDEYQKAFARHNSPERTGKVLLTFSPAKS